MLTHLPIFGSFIHVSHRQCVSSSIYSAADLRMKIERKAASSSQDKLGPNHINDCCSQKNPLLVMLASSFDLMYNLMVSDRPTAQTLSKQWLYHILISLLVFVCILKNIKIYLQLSWVFRVKQGKRPKRQSLALLFIHTLLTLNVIVEEIHLKPDRWIISAADESGIQVRNRLKSPIVYKFILSPKYRR